MGTLLYSCYHVFYLWAITTIIGIIEHMIITLPSNKHFYLLVKVVNS